MWRLVFKMKVLVTYGSGTPLKDCYSIVEGETYADCLKEIFSYNG